MSGYKSRGPGPNSGGGLLVIHRSSSEEASPLLPPAMSQDGCKAITCNLVGLGVLLFVAVSLFQHLFFCPSLFPSQKREDEEGQKLNMFWGNIEAHTCTTYATRDYTAQLMNLPTTWEHRVEACKATPLEVHGVSYLPKSCEDKGPGVVIGRWEANQHEADCRSFWLWYKDKGCTSPGSGKRRIEHYLENLPRGSDWREFCATTPAHFLGMEFPGAQECFQYNSGTYGHWEIDDSSCQ